MKIIVKSLVLISLFLGTQLVMAGSFIDYATVTSVEKVTNNTGLKSLIRNVT